MTTPTQPQSHQKTIIVGIAGNMVARVRIELDRRRRQLGFALMFAWLYGVNPAVQGELLPHKVRVSGYSIADSLCLALFGGTTPLVAAYLVERTASELTPVWYLIALSLISLAAVCTIPETRERDIRV